MNSTLDILQENLEYDGVDYFLNFEDYQLRFERLLFDDQFYIALYKKHDKDYGLLFPKVPMKIGKVFQINRRNVAKARGEP